MSSLFRLCKATARVVCCLLLAKSERIYEHVIWFGVFFQTSKQKILGEYSQRKLRREIDSECYTLLCSRGQCAPESCLLSAVSLEEGDSHVDPNSTCVSASQGCGGGTRTGRAEHPGTGVRRCRQMMRPPRNLQLWTMGPKKFREAKWLKICRAEGSAPRQVWHRQEKRLTDCVCLMCCYFMLTVRSNVLLQLKLYRVKALYK